MGNIETDYSIAPKMRILIGVGTTFRCRFFSSVGVDSGEFPQILSNFQLFLENSIAPTTSYHNLRRLVLKQLGICMFNFSLFPTLQGTRQENLLNFSVEVTFRFLSVMAKEHT